MKKMIKNVLVLTSAISVFGLVACSHDNPLKTNSQEETLDFIRKASTFSEKKLNYKVIGHGDAYLWCMKRELNKEKNFCPKLYEYMVEYSKDTKFDGLTIADLTDKKFFESDILGTSYSFNAIPIR